MYQDNAKFMTGVLVHIVMETEAVRTIRYGTFTHLFYFYEPGEWNSFQPQLHLLVSKTTSHFDPCLQVETMIGVTLAGQGLL